MNKTSTPTKAGSAQVDTEQVADDFIAVVTHVMKRSSAPMVSFVERYDLNFTQLKSMFALSNADTPLPIGRIAEISGASLPATGRAVDGLVRHDLVTRTEDPEDRRVKRIELTPLGNESMDHIYERRVSALRDFLDLLSEDELNDIASALKPLSDQIADTHSEHETEVRG